MHLRKNLGVSWQIYRSKVSIDTSLKQIDPILSPVRYFGRTELFCSAPVTSGKADLLFRCTPVFLWEAASVFVYSITIKTAACKASYENKQLNLHFLNSYQYLTLYVSIICCHMCIQPVA